MHTFISIIILILILGVLVFVHELGHFTLAKLFGIRVDEFGMGLPPRAARLFSWKGTEYTLNWIPFGGFVKIHGEDSIDPKDPDYGRSIGAKKWWQQILVLVAGVTMNVILAWILFSATFMVGAPVAASQTDHPELLRNPVLTVLEVASKSPAEAAGIHADDEILKASTPHAIIVSPTADGFTTFVQSTVPGDSITLKLDSGSGTRVVTATPVTGIVPGHVALGVSVDIVGYQAGLPFFSAFGEGWHAMWYAVATTAQAFWHLVTGKLGLNSLSGPVGLTKTVGDAARLGFLQVVLLAAYISINLAVINILPFPALDGGRILFVIIETVIRRPLPRRFVEWANGIGFSLLILLMLVITVKDIIKLF